MIIIVKVPYLNILLINIIHFKNKTKQNKKPVRYKDVVLRVSFFPNGQFFGNFPFFHNQEHLITPWEAKCAVVSVEWVFWAQISMDLCWPKLKRNKPNI